MPRTLLNYQVKGAKFDDETLKIRLGGQNNDEWGLSPQPPAAKGETIHACLQLLPPEIQDHAKQAEKKFISVLFELTKAYLQKEEAAEEDHELKPIVVGVKLAG